MRKMSVFILIVAAILIGGCKEKIKPGTEKVERPRVSGIRTEAITPSVVDEYYETSGTVKAKTVSSVASRVMGTVTSIRVREGDRVAAGHLLLTIDDSDVAQRLKGAREGYREAQKALEAADENRILVGITYGRYKKMYDDKALTGQEFDQIKTQKRVADIDYERAKAAVGRAEAGVNEVKVYEGFTRVTSPVAGIVTEKKIEAGSMAVPGMPLLTVEDNSSYRIDINVDERLAGKIRTGMEAEAFLESMNRHIRGLVTEVVPSVDPVSRSFLVKIGVKDEGLRNGFYAKVSIPVGKRETLLVPEGAIVERGQLTGLYVVDKESVIVYRLVKVGRRYGGGLEILSGLNPGDRVVVEGVDKAVDGGLAVEAAKSDR
ncbi:MAG: efflux RND transporter periplasmic adaptor subunit [Nitrospiraceae bacterium]|nr:efflux RND transporter periplasmic adaptor subunit [Nitrospiraceae bacterium]